MKKISAAALAVMVLLSIALAAYADEASSSYTVGGTITVSYYVPVQYTLSLQPEMNVSLDTSTNQSTLSFSVSGSNTEISVGFISASNDYDDTGFDLVASDESDSLHFTMSYLGNLLKPGYGIRFPANQEKQTADVLFVMDSDKVIKPGVNYTNVLQYIIW